MAMVYGDDPRCGIKKRVLNAGRGNLSEFKNDTKVKYKRRMRINPSWKILEYPKFANQHGTNYIESYLSRVFLILVASFTLIAKAKQGDSK